MGVGVALLVGVGLGLGLGLEEAIGEGDGLELALPPEVLDLKVAVTLFEVSITTSQAALPSHAPLQPVNSEPASGLAVNETLWPEG